MISRFRRKLKHATFSSVAVAALAGCAAVGPDFAPPEAPVPDSWESVQDAGLQATAYELVEWWEVFSDPVLNQLVEIAQQQNYSLELAGLKVLESRAQLGIATGLRYPQQQFVDGGATRIEHFQTGQFQ